MHWIANQGIEIPSVLVDTYLTSDYFIANFTVEESAGCFRSEVTENGGRCWEDSCVEVFLKNPVNPAEYYNFEVTSREFILAARGTNRENRTLLNATEISSIRRRRQLASVIGNFICWGMEIQIPASLFGLKNFDGISPIGNLYKCADKAKTPHYLSAFPIDTEKPDFHRPEFFKPLLMDE